jgi:hypothetical protein
VFTQKQKLLEAEDEDTSFLDELEGAELEIMVCEESKSSPLTNLFEEQRHQIKEPFDESHRAFIHSYMVRKAAQ